MAQDAGKDAGLVTTARVTHASRLVFYAHIANVVGKMMLRLYSANCSPKDNV
ncbi:hypothetical protein DOY81_009134 [Sarcophaga bullata]|nr:hypothetical protein DOY81_009134 [Sarcophaga bullata]